MYCNVHYIKCTKNRHDLVLDYSIMEESKVNVAVIS